MILKINKQELIYNFFEYIIACVIIVNCRSIWTVIPSVRVKVNFITSILLILSCCMCVFVTKKTKKALKNAFMLFLFTLCYMCVFLIFNSRHAIEFLILSVCVASIVFYAYVIFRKNSFPTLFLKYIHIATLLAMISIIMWLAGPILNILKPSGYVVSTWTGTNSTVAVPSYYGIHFEAQTYNLFDNLLIRNTSVFAEAPMASFVFSLAFLFEILLNPKTCKLRILILGTAIITTMSTTGIIILILSITIKYILNKENLSLFRILKIIIVPLIICLGIVVVLDLFVAKLSESSGSLRLDDFRIGLEAWMENPLFGAGYLNEEVLKSRMGFWRSYNMGYSNSIFYLLSQGGLYLGLPYLLAPFISIKNNLCNYNIRMIFFTAICCFAIAVTIVSYQYITIILIAFFYFSGSKVKYNKNIKKRKLL